MKILPAYIGHAMRKKPTNLTLSPAILQKAHKLMDLMMFTSMSTFIEHLIRGELERHPEFKANELAEEAAAANRKKK